MKIVCFLASFLLTLSLAISSCYATNSQRSGSQGSGSSNSQNINQDYEPQVGSIQPVLNQKQVQTQNQGEEQQLQVKTHEQQETETGKGLAETRSSVAQQIQELLTTQSATGGIGDQVKQWAKTQQQSETKIQEHLTKIESKTGLARSLFGPDYGTLNALKQEMNQNKVRIQQLGQLQLKLTNQLDITNVQEMIELLNQENTSLQEKINLEEVDEGVLGWLVRLFTK